MAARSTLEPYLREIDATPLLRADEERQLAYRIQQGDAEARDHLVRANLRLVVNLARRYPGRGLSLPDLIAEGNLGLMRAVEAYDPAMNTRFSTYATYWIRQSMKRAVINTAKAIRLPAYMEQLLSDWRRATVELQDQLGRAPTEDEVAGHLHLPPKKLALVKKALRIHQGLPQTGQGDEEATLDELVASAEGPSPGAALADREELGHVLGLLDRLDPREAEVLRLRFGLNGRAPLSLTQIGERLRLTRQRICQLERDARQKLKALLLAGKPEAD
jgi:RNA polymerase primary sigma factor